MTGRQLQKLLDAAGLSQRGAAKALEIHERTMRTYIKATRIPKSVEFAVRYLAEHPAEFRSGEPKT